MRKRGKEQGEGREGKRDWEEWEWGWGVRGDRERLRLCGQFGLRTLSLWSIFHLINMDSIVLNYTFSLHIYWINRRKRRERKEIDTEREGKRRRKRKSRKGESETERREQRTRHWELAAVLVHSGCCNENTINLWWLINNRYLFLTVLEAEKVKIIKGRFAFCIVTSCFTDGHILSHMAKVAAGPADSVRALIPCMRTPPSWPIHLPISPPGWLGFQYINLGEHIHSDHSSEIEKTLSKTDNLTDIKLLQKPPFQKAIHFPRRTAYMFSDPHPTWASFVSLSCSLALPCLVLHPRHIMKLSLGSSCNLRW